MLRRNLLVAILCCIPFGTTHAFETVLRIDESASFIDQASPGTEGVYQLPAGGEITFVFGERDGDVVPVTIPVDGLRLGSFAGDGVPPLRIRLTSPASGSLTIAGENAGALEIVATVVAEAIGRHKSVTYALRFSTASTPLVDRAESWDGLAVRPADRYVQLVATARVKDDRIAEAGNFYAVLSGTFDQLPEALE